MKNMFITRCFDAWVTLKSFMINVLFTVFSPRFFALPRLRWIICIRETVLRVLMLFSTQKFLTVLCLHLPQFMKIYFPGFTICLWMFWGQILEVTLIKYSLTAFNFFYEKTPRQRIIYVLYIVKIFHLSIFIKVSSVGLTLGGLFSIRFWLYDVFGIDEKIILEHLGESFSY